MSECVFCGLGAGDRRHQHTEWFAFDEAGLVCEDLNPKGWVMRLLYVPPWHVHVRDATPAMEALARERLGSVALRLQEERGLVVAYYDVTEFSCPWHWHAQACLTIGGGNAHGKPRCNTDRL